MRALRLLGLMFMALFALSASVVATASAAERGVLTLAEAKEVKLSQEKEEALQNFAGFAGAIGTLECRKIQAKPITWTEPGKTHFNLAKDAPLIFSECQSALLASECSTGTEAGVVSILLDVHLVNILDKAAGKLIPGFLALVLSAKLTPLLIITCGATKIEVKGILPRLVKVASLASEVSAVNLQFVKSVVCDEANETVCAKLLKEQPLLLNLGGGFEKLTVESEALLLKISTDVLWDD